MKIDSVRFRSFATNSSSVHTPILVTRQTPKDYLLEHGYDFGWDSFIAASPEAKQYYAALVLRSNLRMYSQDIQKAILRDWVGLVPPDNIDHGYIDHQSIPVIPMDYDRKGPSMEYFKDYYNWIMRPNVVIEGGNDNGDCEDDYPKLLGTRLKKPYIEDNTPLNFVTRKDPKGFYTIFSIEDGTKVRVSFDDSVELPLLLSMSKSTTPELVDLKITDWCDSNCHYCYQGSTIRGKHADSEYIKYTLMNALANMKVFEVAIGGGEPTAHPEFWEILYAASSLGIKPSFSTRWLDWIQIPRHVKSFRDHCGAFAYSVDNEWEVHTLAKSLIKYDLEGAATVQVVPETMRFEDIRNILRVAHTYDIKVTMLGFKTTGRGANFMKNQRSADQIKYITSDQWRQIFEMGCTVSVDTAFAEKHKKLLKEIGVADWSYNIKEGAHSMYIDAVTGEVAASSYGLSSDRLIIPDTLNTHDVECELTKAFKGY